MTVTHRRRTKAEIEAVHAAIIQIVTNEHPITVRRIHYALVGLGLQANELGAYRELSRRVTDLRRDGLIPYEYVVDNARETVIPNMWDNPTDFLDDVRRAYRRNPWQDKDDRVLVMVEKDALRNVILPTTNLWGVGLSLARGRASESFLWDTAQTINAAMNNEYDGTLHVAYLGDWDPTGWASPLDIERRLSGFLDDPARMVFERIGLNPAQITALRLPPQIAKAKDPNLGRWPGGSVSVELDAAPATAITGWISDFINDYLVAADLTASNGQQAKDQHQIEALIDSLTP